MWLGFFISQATQIQNPALKFTLAAYLIRLQVAWTCHNLTEYADLSAYSSYFSLLHKLTKSLSVGSSLWNLVPYGAYPLVFRIQCLILSLQLIYKSCKAAFCLSHFVESTGHPVYSVTWEVFHKLPKSYSVGPTPCELAFWEAHLPNSMAQLFIFIFKLIWQAWFQLLFCPNLLKVLVTQYNQWIGGLFISPSKAIPWTPHDEL